MRLLPLSVWCWIVALLLLVSKLSEKLLDLLRIFESGHIEHIRRRCEEIWERHGLLVRRGRLLDQIRQIVRCISHAISCDRLQKVVEYRLVKYGLLVLWLWWASRMMLLSITRSLALMHSIHITTHAHRSASTAAEMMLLLIIIVLSGATTLMHIVALTLFKLLFFEFDWADFPIYVFYRVFELFLCFLSFFQLFLDDQTMISL